MVVEQGLHANRAAAKLMASQAMESGGHGRRASGRREEVERRCEERRGVTGSRGGREMGIERAGLSLLSVCVRGGGRRMEGIEEGRH